MKRALLVLALSLYLAPLARSQDMPLSQILIEGEGWKKAEGQPPSPTFGVKIEGLLVDKLAVVREEYTIGSRRFTITSKLADPTPPRPVKRLPNAGVVSLDGATVFLGYDDVGDVWAYQARADGALEHGHPYCPIRRSNSGRKPEPNQPSVSVTGMTTDKDGRIYAATQLGVQVFDPTGRLCGVLTPAATGKPGQLMFEGDKLTTWIGKTKYVRKLNTTGVKP